MNAKRLTGMACLALAFTLTPRGANAQTFPVVPGALEIQAGVAAIVLPEETNGTFSIQPLVKIGFFVMEGLELQLEANARVWPRGAVAPSSSVLGGGVAWYPNLGAQNRNVFLAGAAGVQSQDSPADGRTWEGFGRGALGFMVPLENTGIGLLRSLHLSMEFREEVHFQDGTDFLSGIALGFAHFR